jgi:parvulin-like peptidyl-prolyl isomerase
LLAVALCSLGLAAPLAAVAAPDKAPSAKPTPDKPVAAPAPDRAPSGANDSDKPGAAGSGDKSDKSDKPDKPDRADDAAKPGAAAALPTAPTGPAALGKGKKLKVEYVVAVVNDAIILNSELEARRVSVLAEAQQIADPKERERRVAKLTSQVLDDMVSEELVVQAGEAAKVEVDSSEVQAAVDEVKQQNNLDDAQLATALSAQGFTIAGYKHELRRQLLRFRTINQLVAPKVQITDEDIRARYDQMARRTEQVQAVKLSHMLFKLPEHATEQQIAEARDKAAKSIERVKGGEEFAKVAATDSDDESTKTTGGELGWFQRGSMANPEWEPIVFAMDKGDVRGPVRGPQGFHVFLVTEIKRSDLKPFAEMKEQISREIRRREMDKQTQTWLEELRKKAYIDIKLQ